MVQYLNYVLFAPILYLTLILAEPADRTLHVRSLPAIKDYQSNIYEVYWEPYEGQLPPIVARVILSPRGGSKVAGPTDADPKLANLVTGEVTLIQSQPPHGPVQITGKISGLTPGKHGLHFHQYADFSAGCSSTGEHFNPFKTPHGGLIDPIRHIGDLGNIIADNHGEAEILLVSNYITLGPDVRSVAGRSLVVHTNQDDHGKGGTPDSVLSGSSGKRLACGFVGIAP